jgi:hypothetical protein
MAAKKASGRKYGPKAQSSVEREMKAFKKGKLKSGSGRKVKNPKQAIAIGLSEARRSGAKVPPPSRSASAKKKSSAKKSGTKKSAAKKSAAKKSAGRRSPAKKTASKKSSRKSSAKKSSGRKSSGRKSASKKSRSR